MCRLPTGAGGCYVCMYAAIARGSGGHVLLLSLGSYKGINCFSPPLCSGPKPCHKRNWLRVPYKVGDSSSLQTAQLLTSQLPRANQPRMELSPYSAASNAFHAAALIRIVAEKPVTPYAVCPLCSPPSVSVSRQSLSLIISCPRHCRVRLQPRLPGVGRRPPPVAATATIGFLGTATRSC